MKVISFLVALLSTFGLVYLLNQPIETTTSIPPIGKLLSPFQGFWQNATPVSTKALPSLTLDGLSKPAKVVFDDRMVPHIFAKNTNDALFIQGYLLAKDRLWQMDIATRSISGRLAEILNPSIVERDKLQRRKGYAFAAENALRSWQKTPKEYAFVEAYTAGVNQYISQLQPKDYPIEFKLMNYSPEPWTTLKSALFLKSMAVSLASRHSDIENTNAFSIFGKDKYDFLYPERNPNNDPIIPKEVEWDFEALPVETAPQPEPQMLSHHQPFPKAPDHLGSNNWAVSGDKTASGFPILCSDPHLFLNLPNIWYELQIHTPEFNCYGVCLPGFPGVTIGFNEYVAWGMTNVSHDVLDWYKIKWVDDKKEAYWLDDQQMKVEKRVETYLLKDGTTLKDTVRYTHWGPIVYEDKDHPQVDLAMRWIGHDPDGNELKTSYGLNKARNHTDYVEAVENFSVPAQNIVFASQEGDIAITLAGKLPLKSEGQGRFIQDGSKRSNAWAGFIPRAHNPAVKNPSRAFVASANQNSTDDTYPYYYNGSRNGFEDYRGRILNQKLAAMSQIDVEQMKALQNDVYGLRAAESLPLLLEKLNREQLSSTQKELLTILENWDYEYDKDEKACILYSEWFQSFYKNCWDEVYRYKDSIAMPYPRHWRTIDMLKETPDHRFFDQIATTEVETAEDIVQLAFQEMSEKVAKAKAAGKSLEWYVHKNTRIKHMGRIPAFASPLLEVGGDGQALNAIKGGAGPSWRMIVDFGPGRKAYGVYPGGQSGNPGSPFYDNMVDTWAKGEYYELLFLKNAAEEDERILSVQSFDVK